MKDQTILITNGIIVNADSEIQANILISGEKIIAISHEKLPADKIINASGKYIFPGGVDEHTHLGSFGGMGFETTTAALVGGTTTLVDFVPMVPGQLLTEAVEMHNQKAQGIASCDYAFHAMVMGGGNQALYDDIQHLPEHGVATVKLLMGYKGSDYFSDDSVILNCMKQACQNGITTMMHCENSDMINWLTKELQAQGETEPVNHYYSRLPICEAEATRRSIDMAILTNAPLFVVHVTIAEAMEVIREAYQRGYNIYGETCTHYLTLDTQYLAKPNFEGAKYVCAPPLRAKDQQDQLWQALSHGGLKAVGSDHCALIGGFETKKKGLGNFTKIPNGAPGMQERMMILWNYGVNSGKISRQKFVEITSFNPARLLNFANKGKIAPGYDADLIIWDQDYQGMITNKDSLHGIDYCTYEGFEIHGRPHQVWLRGELMVKEGHFVGKSGQGKRQFARPYGMCFDHYDAKKQREGQRF